MSEPFTVLLASANLSAIDRFRGYLEAEADFSVDIKVLDSSGPADALIGNKQRIDLLILVLGANWEQELSQLGSQSRAALPPLVVIAPEGDMAIMRKAMQVGARDFMGLKVDKADLLKSVLTIVREERRKSSAAPAGTITAVVNSKGGSGASFVAGSIASALAGQPGRKVALLDLDLQFGVQALALDLKPKNNLMDALNMGSQLDAVALEGFMTQHKSGLRLLGEYGGQLPLPWEIDRKNLLKLLQVASQAYDHVLVDLPRQIDPLTTTVLDAADTICVVMHQSLPHVRDTRNIIGILTRELGIPPSRIKVVVNRYQAEASVTLKDIKTTIEAELILIPNDYRRVSDAMNHGVPVNQSNPNAPISKALMDAALGLVGSAANKVKAGGLRGKLAGLFGQSSER